MYLRCDATYHPLGLSVNPFTYKTAVFEGESLRDAYTYMRNNPEIFILQTNSIEHNWGDQIVGPVVGYTQNDNTWEPTDLPRYPIALRWIISTCDITGNNCTPIGDLTTGLN